MLNCSVPWDKVPFPGCRLVTRLNRLAEISGPVEGRDPIEENVTSESDCSRNIDHQVVVGMGAHIHRDDGTKVQMQGLRHRRGHQPFHALELLVIYLIKVKGPKDLCRGEGSSPSRSGNGCGKEGKNRLEQRPRKGSVRVEEVVEEVRVRSSP